MYILQTCLGGFSGIVTLWDTNGGTVFATQIRERERERERSNQRVTCFHVQNIRAKSCYLSKIIFASGEFSTDLYLIYNRYFSFIGIFLQEYRSIFCRYFNHINSFSPYFGSFSRVFAIDKNDCKNFAKNATISDIFIEFFNDQHKYQKKTNNYY